MSRFLDLYGGCLRNSPQRRKNVNKERKELPGQRFSGNDQCHLMYGVGWTHYLGQVRGERAKTCEAIWCRRQFSLRSPNAAALQGTSCGHERHCEGGLCVKKIEPGDESGDGGIFWERFSEASKVTTIATTKAVTTSTNDPGRVIYFPQTFNICQFFAQFGIRLKTCES